MTTKIPAELSSTPGIADSSNATAITIDSNEKVGINNTTPGNSYSLANNLVVGDGSTHEGITIFTGTSNTGAFHFADGAGGGDAANTYAGYIAYDHANDRMRLGAGSSDRVRISTDGLLFGTDTAAANALDDYEAGTWSPTAAGVATAASYGARYTKIGQLVMAECYILIATQNNTDQFRIGGLPYTSHNVTAYGGGSIGYVGSSNLDFLTAPLIPGNASYAYFHYIDGQNSGASVTNNKMYSIESGNQLFIMQCFYRTA